MMHIKIGDIVRLKGADPDELGEVTDINPDECLVEVLWFNFYQNKPIWYKNKELILVKD